MYNLNLGNIIINLITLTIYLILLLYTYLCAHYMGTLFYYKELCVDTFFINMFFHNYISRKSDRDIFSYLMLRNNFASI